MIRLVNEEFMENGNYIVVASERAIIKVQDLESTKGKHFTDWTQLVRYCIQQLKQNKYVEIINVKTYEILWLKPAELKTYIQSGGILDEIQ